VQIAGVPRNCNHNPGTAGGRGVLQNLADRAVVLIGGDDFVPWFELSLDRSDYRRHALAGVPDEKQSGRIRSDKVGQRLTSDVEGVRVVVEYEPVGVGLPTCPPLGLAGLHLERNGAE